MLIYRPDILTVLTVASLKDQLLNKSVNLEYFSIEYFRFTCINSFYLYKLRNYYIRNFFIFLQPKQNKNRNKGSFDILANIKEKLK